MNRREVIVLTTGAAFATLAAGAPGALAAPPQQLHNKSVTNSVGIDFVARDETGREQQVRWVVERQIYISTAGRVFSRVVRHLPGTRTFAEELAPKESRNSLSESLGGQFVGNTMVMNIAFVSGALKGTVTFDPSFRACTVAVQFGRTDGAVMKRKSPRDGKVYEISSVRVSPQSCSVQEGNISASGEAFLQSWRMPLVCDGSHAHSACVL